MDENPVAGLQAGIDELQCCIDKIVLNVSRIRGIYEVQNESVTSPRDEVLRVVFRGGPARVPQRLAMIRLFAGMDHAPSRFVPDF